MEWDTDGHGYARIFLFVDRRKLEGDQLRSDGVLTGRPESSHEKPQIAQMDADDIATIARLHRK